MSRISTRRALLSALGAGAVAATAGCVGVLEDGYDVEYTLANDDDEAYDVAQFVLSPDDQLVDVTFDDGSTETHDVDELGRIVGTAPDRVAGVRPVGDPVDEAAYELDPGDEVGGRFEGVPEDGSVTGVATPPGGGPPLTSFGSMWCSPGADLTFIESRLTTQGTIDSVSCRAR